MDAEEANKFINTLVKNLQVLCHGHVSFNSSIQVIGHLYLNVDSDTNIDYIVNEKVCKSDTSSTVFVSKSYHSEPKASVKPGVNKNKPVQNAPAVPIMSHKPHPLQSQKRQHARQSIHPAYREQIDDLNLSLPISFEQPPSKMPRFSMKGFKMSSKSLNKPAISTSHIKREEDNIIDLCRIKKEPSDAQPQDEALQLADNSNEPSVYFENDNDSSFSSHHNESLTAIPVTFQDNKNNQNFSLDQFSQFSDSSASTSQYDSGEFQDGQFKMREMRNYYELMMKRQKIVTVSQETNDTIIDLVLGRFNIPIRERTLVQKAAIVRYYRAGKEKWEVKLDNSVYKLYYSDKEVFVQS